jgi:hypothetical protein
MTPQLTFNKPQQVITFIPQSNKSTIREKVLVLDSGTLINLSMNGLLYVIPELKKISYVRFAITEQVKYETVDRPSHIPRFELGAVRIKEMINSGELELPSAFSIPNEAVSSTTKKLMEFANHTVEARGKWVSIVSEAEMSCLALSEELTKREIQNMIAIDERTTRILAEKPENLQKLMGKKLHFNVSLEKKNFSEFEKFRFIRSTELVYVAFKRNVLKLKDPKALEAALYATKYKGSSISFEEIDVLKKL